MIEPGVGAPYSEGQTDHEHDIAEGAYLQAQDAAREEMRELVARAEAAEARVKALETAGRALADSCEEHGANDYAYQVYDVSALAALRAVLGERGRGSDRSFLL